MKLAFLGTSEFAVPALSALVEAGHDVVAVYTRAPKPAGRGQQERRTPVHELALSLGLAVRTPKGLRNEEEATAFKALDLDAAVVVSYGHILPKAFLEAPVLGCINIHGSLLPRWRGAAPVQRAIMAGDLETGVTIMQMEAGLDTGPMLLKRIVAINGKNAGELTEELAELGAAAMIDVLDDLSAYPPTAQPEEGATYAPKISKEEAPIEWSRTAAGIVRQVQGLAPFPGAWLEYEGERIKLLAAYAVEASGEAGEVLDERLTIACASGALRPTLVQRAGKGVMSPEEMLRGFAIPEGTLLG